MLHQFLICSLLAHAIWALPAAIPQQHPIDDIASHIVIVTPQAEVHLEPTLKYDSGAFIQHLAPVARFASPREETIVYYPASAAAAAVAAGSILPIEAATTISRTDTGADAGSSVGTGTKQYETIIEQIQTAIQTGTSTLGPQLTEAAAAAASAAASAGSSFFPGLFPANAAALAPIAEKAPEGPQKLIELKPELTPAATQSLISDGRRFYALAPAPVPLPQVIDLVHAPIAGPVLLSPVAAIRARSIAHPELPVVVLSHPEAPKTEALPLQKKKTELKENKCDAKKIEAEKEKEKEKEKSKNNEFGRLLEGTALNAKEQQQEQQKEQQEAFSAKPLEQNLKQGFIKSKEEQLPAANAAESQQQSVPLSFGEEKLQAKSAVGDGGGGLVVVPPQSAAIADDTALPQGKANA